jgi:hypothetical protein
VRRAILLGATVCSALVIGCGRGSTTVNVPPPKPGAKPAAQDHPSWATTLEGNLGHAESDEERIQYLKKMSTDPKFDAKEHKPILEEYSKDKNKELASAAQALLDKAK